MKKPENVELLIGFLFNFIDNLLLMYLIRHTFCKLPNISEVYNCLLRIVDH